MRRRTDSASETAGGEDAEAPKKNNFSVIYFGLIYLYTLVFSLLSGIPGMSHILTHLPHPQNLVSDTYQPISHRRLPQPSDEQTHATSTAIDPMVGGRQRRSSIVQEHQPGSAPNKSITGGSGGAVSRNMKRKTLVLDLDETLIHSSPQGSYRAHHRIEVIIDKMACLYYVYKRPHVDYFLRKVSEWYKVVIFTASLAEYADPVIDLLDSQRKYISARYFRESCVPHDSNYAKDLCAVDPDLSQVILVDNSPVSYYINPTNGIPIQPWVNSDPKDEALLDLLPLLDALRFTDDVRSILSLRIV